MCRADSETAPDLTNPVIESQSNAGITATSNSQKKNRRLTVRQDKAQYDEHIIAVSINNDILQKSKLLIYAKYVKYNFK